MGKCPSSATVAAVLLQLAETQGQEEEFDECMKRIPERNPSCALETIKKGLSQSTQCV